MLCAIIQMEKLAALQHRFLREGLLCGSTAGHFDSSRGEESELDNDELASGDEDSGSDVGEHASQEKPGVEGCLGDVGPENGPPSLSLIVLTATPGIQKLTFIEYILNMFLFYRKTVSKRPLQVGAVHQ